MAVFEYNGRLSILPKAERRPATPEDLKIPVKVTSIGVEVIMDGRILGKNLLRSGKDEEWLGGQLRLQGYRSAREILLGVYRPEEGTVIFYPME